MLDTVILINPMPNYHTPSELGITPRHYTTADDCLRACEVVREYMKRKIVRIPVGKRTIQALEIKANKLCTK